MLARDASRRWPLAFYVPIGMNRDGSLPGWANGTPATIALVLVVGAFLRFFNLDAQSLWNDEAFSWRMTRFPWSEVIRRTADDVHPPLYYLVLKAWVAVAGDSVFALRALSASLDCLNILLLFSLARALYPTRGGGGKDPEDSSAGVPLLATALLTLSIFAVIHAREVRMYPLGGSLALASSLALWKALNHDLPASPAWAVYVLSALGLAYTHNYGLFTVAAQGVFATCLLSWRARWDLSWTARFRRFQGACAAFLILVLAYAPWYPVVQRQRAEVAKAYWIIAPLDLTRVSGAIEQLFTGNMEVHLSVTGWVSVALAVTLLIAILTGRRAADAYVFLLIVVPFGLAAATSLAQGRNILIGKYLFFTFPFLLVAIARIALRIPGRFARRAVVSLLLFNLIVQDGITWFDADVPGRPGLRAAASMIARECREGDLVLTVDTSAFLATSYYLRHESLLGTYIVLPDGRGPESKKNQGGAAILDSDCLHPIDLSVRKGGRAWIVMTDIGSADQSVLPSHWKWRFWATYPDAAPFRGDTHVYTAEIEATPRGRRADCEAGHPLSQ